MADVIGTATITIASLGKVRAKGVTINKGGFPNQKQSDDTGVVGDKRGEHVAPRVTMNIVYTGEITIDQFDAIKNDTITIQGDNGETWVLDQATRADVLELAVNDGQLPIMIDGARLTPQ